MDADRTRRFISSPDTYIWHIGDVKGSPFEFPENPTSRNLREEFINNGFGHELEYIRVNTDPSNLVQYKIMSADCAIRAKRGHKRYIKITKDNGQFAEMTDDELLAVILYTGGGAYEKMRLCASRADWNTWPRFTQNLLMALAKLQRYSYGPIKPTKKQDYSFRAPKIPEIVRWKKPLYHGIRRATTLGAEGGGEERFWLKFMIPISTSADPLVALAFAAGNTDDPGLLLRFEEPFLESTLGADSSDYIAAVATHYADISWLSQYPMEKEVLIFPSGDCMKGQFVTEMDLNDAGIIREYKCTFTGDWSTPMMVSGV